MRHVQRVVETHKMKVNGLHMHTGSDILDAEVFLRGAELLFEAAMQFKDLEFMDFGSGFKVGYKEGDIVTAGQAIGTIGTSGRVDRPQLHFEIRKSRQPVDPRNLIS